jgi:predicted DNA-binding transcriptional regulator AlpA
MRVVLPPPEAAEYVGLSQSYLAKDRVYGGPDAIPHVKLGARRVGYLIADLDAWLAARRRRSTSEMRVAA